MNNNSFLYDTPAWLIAVLLFVLMLLVNAAGYFVKQRHQRNGLHEDNGLGPIEGALLGLLALLLSFTFGMSADRYEARKQVIVEEANNIGTVILRADLYPDSIRTVLRQDLQAYVEARISYYEAGFNATLTQKAEEATAGCSGKVWHTVAAFAANGNNPAVPSQQMVPALNAMIDIVTTEEATTNARVPDSILWLLFLLTLCGSFIIGYSNKGKRTSYVIVSVFALMTAMAIFLIIDLDRPRRGLINTHRAQEKIMELRNMFR